MINKYITATILALTSSNVIISQVQQSCPKLVINITIDQLRTDYIEDFYPLYGENGLKKLLNEGSVYNNAQYSFYPIDRASAIASIITGSSPSKNGITGSKWLNKKTLLPTDCTENKLSRGYATSITSSPINLLVTTINDELKIKTENRAITFSIAKEKDAAIMSGGHATNGVLWFDKSEEVWCSSTYYFKNLPTWVKTYNSTYKNIFTEDNINSNITNLALNCIEANNMGADEITDMITLTYDMSVPEDINNQQRKNTYIQLDKELEKLISRIENRIGRDNVLFIITSTGYFNEKDIDYSKYNISSGTFYINRTVNLLNMYLGAIYGQDKYIENCFKNQIFFNWNLIERKRINIDELINRAQSFLIQNEGVSNVYTNKDLLLYNNNSNNKLCNWYNSNNCGDIIIEILPGWKLLNEENQQQYTSRENSVIFPIIFYGAGIKHTEISTPVTTDRIAPTIAKIIRIRAPNACTATPLF